MPCWTCCEAGKDDPQSNVKECWGLICQYEGILSALNKPEEKTRAQRMIRARQALIQTYEMELNQLGAPLSGAESS